MKDGLEVIEAGCERLVGQMEELDRSWPATSQFFEVCWVFLQPHKTIGFINVPWA